MDAIITMSNQRPSEKGGGQSFAPIATFPTSNKEVFQTLTRALCCMSTVFAFLINKKGPCSSLKKLGIGNSLGALHAIT